MKKRLAIIVALVMLLSLAIPFGATANANLLHLRTDGDATFEDGFSVYKVFDLERDADGGFNYTIAAAFDDFSYNGLKGEALADYIYTLSTNSPEMRELTDALVRYVNDPANSVPDATVDSNGVGGTALTIEVASNGYYFVVGQVEDVETGSIAHYMALLSTTQEDGEGELSPLTINPKFDMPKITKQVDIDSGGQGSIGDQLFFSLNTAVPLNIGAFDEYIFIVHDKMHNLTYVDDSVNVTVGTVNSVSYYDYTVVYNAATKDLTITFDSDEFLALPPGELIYIEYSVTIDAAAITLDADGNPLVDANNEVTLEYSNDPLGDGTGTYDDEPPIRIFTFWFDFYKHSGAVADSLPLGGVTFALSKDDSLQDDIRAGDLDGTFWFDVITPVPGSATAGYAIYRLAEDQSAGGGRTQVITTPASGIVRIMGLGADTYQLYEIATNPGFTLLPGPVAVTITQLTPGAGDFTVTGPGGGLGRVNIQNNRDSGFPETGGIGTYIFYFVGTLIMAGSIALLIVRRKRASAK